MNRIASVLCLIAWMTTCVNFTWAEEKQPDVVFIIVDDLNDWVGCLGGHPDAKSPHIDALAASGMLFSQAYCNSPQCRPSRTSLNYGVYPFKTGTYFNAKHPNETRITTPTMQQFFMENGYRVVSGGKVFHGTPGRGGRCVVASGRGTPNRRRAKTTFNAMRAPNDGYALDVADRSRNGRFQGRLSGRPSSGTEMTDKAALHVGRLLPPASPVAGAEALVRSIPTRIDSSPRRTRRAWMTGTTCRSSLGASLERTRTSRSTKA